jgi:PAS domain S-box-containing protein
LAISALAAGIFVLDCFTPMGMADSVLYMVPLLLSFYAGGRILPYLLAAIFSALILVGYDLSPPGMDTYLALINTFLGLSMLWVVAFLVAQYRWTSDEARKLWRAVEHSPSSIVVTDVKGNITYVNPKFSEITGYSPEEVVGRNPRVLKSGETPPEEYKRLWEKITAGGEWHGTFHNRKKNGDLFWEAASIAPVLNEAGQITHYVAVKEDITERKRAEDALRESELRYRSLFANMQEGFAYCRMIYEEGRPVDFVYLAVNSAFETITGLSEVVGKKVSEVIPGIKTAHPELFEVYGKVASSGGSERLEVFMESLQVWLDVSVYSPARGHFAAIFENINERKEAADALRKSERRFRRFVENNAAGVLSNLLDGRILDCNQTLARILGYDSPEELKILRTQDLYFNPDDRRALLDLFNENHRLADYEICFKRKDGRPVWVLVNISLAKGADGEPDCMEGTVIDITERKQTRDFFEFVAQEGWTGGHDAFFGRLAERLGHILGVDYVFVGRLKDPRTVQTTGFYAKGKIVPDMEYAARRAPCLALGHKMLCQPQHTETLQKLCPDDPLLAEMGVQNCVAFPMMDSSGKPFGLMAVMHTKPIPDAHLASALLQIASVRVAGEMERLEAAKSLRESENRYRQLVETSPDAIFIQCDRKFVFLNSAALKLFGATHPDQILHRSGLDFVHPKHRERVAARMAVVLEEQRSVPVIEMQYLRLDGSVAEAEVAAIPFTFNQRRAAQVVARDITERKQLESQVLRLQRMESLGTLAGGIAHDLNNVLTPLMFSVEMLREKVSDAEGQQMLLSFKANVQRAASLVKQVLTFGRGLEGARVLVQPARVALEIGHLIQQTFPKLIEFSYHSAPDLWSLTGDATQLHQVLLNLAVNARDAMPNGGRLTIGLENVDLDEIAAAKNLEARPGPYVLIHVADTGTGIPEEIRDRIFEPFFTTKRPGQGTGLGLSTTLGIVKSHGGFITCQSEPGKGTTFKVYLPASVTADKSEKTADEQAQLPLGHGELVLVVDDEAAIRKVVRGMLERFGYRVLLAADGAEAVSVYSQRREEIALVITDMAMPVMDGPATIAALIGINPQVRIVASSGLSSASDVGTRPFIPKPYDAETMLRVLHEALRE